MGDTPSKRVRYDNLLTPQDVASAAEVSTNTGMYRSMAGYSHGVVIVTAHLANTKTAIAQLTQSSAAAVAGKADVSGFTVTLTGTTAAPEQVGCIDFNVEDLTSAAAAKYFVGCDITTNGNGDDVGAVLARHGGRHQESTMDV